MAILLSSPYISAIMTVPDSMFANRRSDMDIGTAMSPITLIGAQKTHGSHNPLINPDTFWYLILLKKIRVNVMMPSGRVVP